VIALYLERVDAAHLLQAVRAYRRHVSEAPAGLARLENVLRLEVEGDSNGRQATGADTAPEGVAPAGYGQNVHGSLLTVAEAARWTRLSEKTVRRRIAAGDLLAVRVGSSPRAPIRVPADELEAWLFGSPFESLTTSERSARVSAPGGTGSFVKNRGSPAPPLGRFLPP
jgi:excisionase family DNA binding protein